MDIDIAVFCVVIVLPLLLLVGPCVVVWKARPLIRTATAAVVFVLLVCFGVLLANIRCMLQADDYGRAVWEYSTYLRDLSKRGDVDRLKASVLKLDEALKCAPNTLVGLAEAVHDARREEFLRQLRAPAEQPPVGDVLKAAPEE